MQNYEKKRNTVRPSVLVVEKNKSLQLILQNVLRENFSVFVCTSLPDSLSFLRNQPFPSLILYDINADPQLGIRSLSFFRENQLFRRIPLMVLVDGESGSGSEPLDLEKKLTDEWGIKEEFWVRKPFDPFMLSQRITTLLSKSDSINE